MTLFLTSSPFVPHADRALINPVNGFLDRMCAVLPEDIRCLVVCSNPDDHGGTVSMANDVRAAFEEAEFHFEDVNVLDGESAEDAQELIEWSNFIVFCGGHVPTQNAFLMELEIGEMLQDYPGVIMGISAGSMNCAETVYAQPEMPGEAIDPDYQRFIPGMGLTDFNIMPHFQDWHDDYLDGLHMLDEIFAPDSVGNYFFVLVDGSYIFIDEERSELCGEAYCLDDGKFEKISDEEDVVVLE